MDWNIDWNGGMDYGIDFGWNFCVQQMAPFSMYFSYIAFQSVRP